MDMTLNVNRKEDKTLGLFPSLSNCNEPKTHQLRNRERCGTPTATSPTCMSPNTVRQPAGRATIAEVDARDINLPSHRDKLLTPEG
jgi:hypothetical protein